MKIIIVKDTPNVRELQKQHGCQFVAQRLWSPVHFPGGVIQGILKKPISIPGVDMPIVVILNETDVQEVESRPLQEILDEAKERSLDGNL